MRYLLATDTILNILKGDQKTVDLVMAVSKTDKQAVSLLSCAEILKQIPEDKKKPVEQFLQAHQLLSINFEISRLASQLWQKQEKKVSGLTMNDCLLMAQAQYYDLDILSKSNRYLSREDIKAINIVKKEIKK